MIQDTSGQDKVVAAKPWWHISQWRKHGAGATLVFLGFSFVAVAYPSYQNWLEHEVSISKDSIRTAKVTRGAFVRDISATGKIVAAHAPAVYSKVSGNVHLAVMPGDEVEKGTVVAKVQSPELSAELKQQESLLSSLSLELERQKLNVRSELLRQQQVLDMAQVTLKAAEREQRRSSISIKKQLISKIDFEQAEDDLAKAKLAFDHAKQETQLKKDQLAFEVKTRKLALERQQMQVDELRRQIDGLTIRAPVTGMVGNWLVEQRSQVQANQALLTVVDLTAYEAQLMVPESYADDIGLGMETQVTVNGVVMKGQIAAISPEVNNSQVTTNVRFDGQDFTGLRQNQRVNARILLANKPDVLMIKRGAFLQSGGGQFTYLVKNGNATKVDIAIGDTSIREIELLSGAEVGDELVISTLEPFERSENVLIR